MAGGAGDGVGPVAETAFQETSLEPVAGLGAADDGLD